MYIDRDYLLKLTTRRPIIAEFKNGTRAEYTTDVLQLLFTDPEVVNVTAADTGEIIFCTL